MFVFLAISSPRATCVPRDKSLQSSWNIIVTVTVIREIEGAGTACGVMSTSRREKEKKIVVHEENNGLDYVISLYPSTSLTRTRIPDAHDFPQKPLL